jgi:hypothetical protein
MSKQQLNIISIIWILVAFIIYPLLLKIKAPYGKYINYKWKPLISNRLGWILMEIPSLFLISYFFFSNSNIYSRFLSLVFLLWILHYIHRSAIFPFMIRTKGKKIPLLIVIFGMIFNIINAGLNGMYMSKYFDDKTLTPLLTLRFAFGLFLFVIGMYINIRADYKLISLRKNSSTTYKIPSGWLYEYISCPNYFGEIIEWCGFAIIAWNLPALSFFIWTIANLLPRSIATHKWYNNYFDNYPKERKAVFPFLL